jgi:hypothetical protein
MTFVVRGPGKYAPFSAVRGVSVMAITVEFVRRWAINMLIKQTGVAVTLYTSVPEVPGARFHEGLCFFSPLQMRYYLSFNHVAIDSV